MKTMRWRVPSPLSFNLNKWLLIQPLLKAAAPFIFVEISHKIWQFRGMTNASFHKHTPPHLDFANVILTPKSCCGTVLQLSHLVAMTPSLELIIYLTFVKRLSHITR